MVANWPALLSICFKRWILTRAGVPERLPFPAALQPRGAADAASAAVPGRDVLDGGFTALSALRAGPGLALPEKYRRRLKSTNMQERLIQEIRRRERVIRIFPNEESAHRLISALLAEIHEEW